MHKLPEDISPILFLALLAVQIDNAAMFNNAQRGATWFTYLSSVSQK
jgi:hypothetical protein